MPQKSFSGIGPPLRIKSSHKEGPQKAHKAHKAHKKA
jgi:hypothetical protein